MEATVTFSTSHRLDPRGRMIFVSLVYVLSLASGFASILWLKPLLAANDLACGKHAVALFVPFASVGAVLAVLVIIDAYSRVQALFLVLLYLILVVGFADLYFQPIWHYYFDDPGRYSNYAHFMLSERTLWGGDAIGGFRQNAAHYVDQPGYRYFLALMIKIFGGENRLMQLGNMLVYLFSILIFLLTIKNSFKKVHFLWIASFFILSLPYAANNILEGLSEWLAVTLFLFFSSFILRERVTAAIIFLALVPFVRQNLLLISGVLVILTLTYKTKGKRRILGGVIFLTILCLPVYHNLYYADELRFLTGNRLDLLVNLNAGYSQILLTILDSLLRKFPHYFGYYPSADLPRTIEAVLFAPLGSGLLLYFLLKLSKPARYWYLAAIGSSLLFSHALLWLSNRLPKPGSYLLLILGLGCLSGLGFQKIRHYEGRFLTHAANFHIDHRQDANQAIELFERVRNHYQIHLPMLYQNLAAAYFTAGAFEKARERVEIMIQKRLDYANGYRLLGKILFSQDRYTEAIQAFRRAGQYKNGCDRPPYFGGPANRKKAPYRRISSLPGSVGHPSGLRICPRVPLQYWENPAPTQKHTTGCGCTFPGRSDQTRLCRCPSIPGFPAVRIWKSYRCNTGLSSSPEAPSRRRKKPGGPCKGPGTDWEPGSRKTPVSRHPQAKSRP